MICEHKKRIITSFNKASETYDANATLHKKICLKLINNLINFIVKTNHIADFGCGTGISTKILLDHFNYELLHAIDISNLLLRKAKINLHNLSINFINSDFEEYIVPKESLNLAFSNMALQWSINLEQTFNVIVDQLKPKGMLAFSIPINGTFLEINDKYKNKFYTIKEITSFFGKNLQTLSVTENVFIEHFNSPIDAIKSIKLIGANCLLRTSKTTNFFNKNILDHIFTNCNNKQLTYQIAYFILQKV